MTKLDETCKDKALEILADAIMESVMEDKVQVTKLRGSLPETVNRILSEVFATKSENNVTDAECIYHAKAHHKTLRIAIPLLRSWEQLEEAERRTLISRSRGELEAFPKRHQEVRDMLGMYAALRAN